MTGYVQIKLIELITQLGENEAKKILSEFFCPLNKDVENFLHHKAIEFAKQGISSTHLVFASYKEKPVLTGYYTLANKTITIDKDALPSKGWKKRVTKFSCFNHDTGKFYISAPLIGQLGKNYANGYDKLITGDELLKMACDKITFVQLELGGRIVYLECEDNPKLTNFYSSNGFITFGKRTLELDETSMMHGEYLLQMLRYL